MNERRKEEKKKKNNKEKGGGIEKETNKGKEETVRGEE